MIEPARPNSDSMLLRTLKAVIVAAFVLPTGLLAAIAIKEWEQLHSAAELRVKRTAAVFREHALKVFETHELIFDRVDDRTRGLSWKDIEDSTDLTSFLKSVVGSNSHVSSLLLVKPDGFLSNNSRRFPLNPPVNVADRDYFRVPASDQHFGIFIDEAVTGRVSGEPIINISRRRASSTGEFSGVTAIAVFLNYFSNFYSSHNPTGNDSVRLVRGDGAVLVSQPPPTTDVRKLSAASGLMTSIHGNATGIYTSVSELDGIRRLFAFEKIGKYPVYVSYGVDLAAVKQQWIASMAVYGLFAGFATIGLAWVGWVALSHARAEQAAMEGWRTESVERERAELLYRQLYNKAPIPQQSLDVSGNLLIVSDTWLELLGYERADVVGRPFVDFLPPEQRTIFENRRADLLDGGLLRDVPLDVLHRDGRRIPVLWSGAVERDAEGQFVKTFGALTDVTARRQAEEALKQAQKIEAIGQLTGGVAHDFNNLLAVIVGNLDLLKKRVAGDPSLTRLVENARQGAERGASLTQRMLSFARRQDLKPEAVDVPTLFRGMEDLVQRSLGPEVIIETHFPLGPAQALVDANQLELALLNLLVNARDAMPSGGTISISLRFEPGPKSDSDRLICLSVSDTGEGMDEVTLARVTEPFFTTKGIGKGTGLGLSMVHGFAEQSGGRLILKSEKGVGTTAELWLPIADASLQHLPAVEALGREPREGALLQLLVVDDDALVRMNTAMMLEDLGHSVVEASSGREALQALEEGEFDLLITDQAMPRMTGVQLAEEVRKLKPKLPILVATGYAELPANVNLPRLSKPFSQKALADAIEAVTRPTASSLS